MSGVLFGKVAGVVERRYEAQNGLSVLDDVSSCFSVPGFKTCVGVRTEAEAGNVEAGCLFGVTYVKGDVVEAVEFTNGALKLKLNLLVSCFYRARCPFLIKKIILFSYILL